ncbi:MAG: DUF302 domain-containing protein [Alphaproteobacteria bacterium]|nr:MAG: DUF302 domain-containing protein [Alphaproteobacteria bacterium]
MSYYFATTLDTTMEDAITRVTEALKERGFGVLTEIDVKATLKKKIGADFRPYVILGSCNPQFAYRALQAESRIGVMLPCNVIVQELEPGRVEVAAVDPIASMAAIENPELEPIAREVQSRLKDVIESLEADAPASAA